MTSALLNNTLDVYPENRSTLELKDLYASYANQINSVKEQMSVFEG